MRHLCGPIKYTSTYSAGGLLTEEAAALLLHRGIGLRECLLQSALAGEQDERHGQADEVGQQRVGVGLRDTRASDGGDQTRSLVAMRWPSTPS